MRTDRSSTPITNGTRRPRVKHYRLLCGWLSNQRPAFAVTSDDTTLLGTCHHVEVWVCCQNGYRRMRDVVYTSPRDRHDINAFALIQNGTEKRVKNNSPAYIARKLGW